MGYEVEIKFRVDDHAAVAGHLARRGVLAGSPVVQDDAYLTHPCRDFARTDEALRIRREGESNYITYKGPKLGGPTKTREELEIAIGDGPEIRGDMSRLFERLGFLSLFEVSKTRLPFRLIYQGRPMVVTLDRVDGLGAYAEVEAFATSQADLSAAQEAVISLAAELGLKEREPRSYLRLSLEKAGVILPSGENPSPPPPDSPPP